MTILKFLVGVLLVATLQSCKERFKHEIGDVTRYKLYSNRVLILDTLTKNGKHYYKIQAEPDCSDCDEASELELY
jgi:hypothetical protein